MNKNLSILSPDVCSFVLNNEVSYMAVSYLQAAFIHKHGKVFGDDEVYNSNKCKCETWEENPFNYNIKCERRGVKLWIKIQQEI